MINILVGIQQPDKFRQTIARMTIPVAMLCQLTHTFRFSTGGILENLIWYSPMLTIFISHSIVSRVVAPCVFQMDEVLLFKRISLVIWLLVPKQRKI